MSKYALFFLLPLCIISCIEKQYLKPLVPHHLIHANSAKTWILDEQIQNDTFIQPEWQQNKLTFTFFNDNKVVIQKYAQLGSQFGEKAFYSFSIHKERKDTNLVFYFENGEEWQFKLNSISYSEMQLEKQFQQNKDSVEFWNLISYQKPF